MESEDQQERSVRVRLFFSDKRLLSKAQRAKGLRRSWAAISRGTATVRQFGEQIKRSFALRCESADDLFLSMDGFVFASFESTCMFRENELIRVETSINKKKGKNIAIHDGSPSKEKEMIEKETILSIENGELSNQKKRQNDHENPESSNKKLKLTPHESPLVINTTNNSRSVVTQTVGVFVASNNNKQIVVKCETGPRADFSEEKRGPSLGKGILGPPPSHLMPGAGQINWQAGQPKRNGSNFKRHNWKNNNYYNSQDGSNRRNNTINNLQSRNCNNNYNVNEEQNKGKNIVENEEESEESHHDMLDFESLYPLIRLPKEGDIIAYRLMDSSSHCLELSPFRVGEVLIFDPVLMEIILCSVPQYPIFPNGEIPRNSLYKQDGTLEIDFGALVDLRLVKESQLDFGPKGNYTKSGKMKFFKGGHNNWKNANGNSDNNWEAGNDFGNSRGNSNTNSAWEAGEGSNTRETQSGWGTWAPSNKRSNIFQPQMGQDSNNGFSSRAVFSRRNPNRGGGNSQRNSGWDATQEATNGNETAQTQENGWETWAPSLSRPGLTKSSGGQNGNFGARGGLGFRGRNGRGGKYNKSKFGK